jgi:hypothetical protein
MAKTKHFGPLAAAAGALVAVGLVVLIMLVVEVRPAEATFPGKPGKIAYAGRDATDFEIYTIKPGGLWRFASVPRRPTGRCRALPSKTSQQHSLPQRSFDRWRSRGSRAAPTT